MRRFASIACTLALVLVACGVVAAQTLDVYQLTYFDNNLPTAPLDSSIIRVINPGLTGSPISADEGTLCANIYVFDATQEMVECCSCPITANGLLTLSVQELTSNPLTVDPFRGVVKIVSTLPAPVCDATMLTANLTPDLRAFATHLQNDSTRAALSLSVTEDEFADAPLSGVEAADLGTICSMVRYLGTGRGRCDDECTAP